jgi:hypothetical protein
MLVSKRNSFKAQFNFAAAKQNHAGARWWLHVAAQSLKSTIRALASCYFLRVGSFGLRYDWFSAES